MRKMERMSVIQQTMELFHPFLSSWFVCNVLVLFFLLDLYAGSLTKD
jgi:hypothetical protein